MIKVVRVPAGVSGLQESKISKRIKQRQNKRCSYNGQEFESLQVLAKHLGVTNMVIYHANRIGNYKGIEIEIIK